MKKTIGIIIILISLFWIYYYGQMILSFEVYDDLICTFRPPLWVAYINTFLSIITMLIGISVIRNQMKVNNAILITLAFLIIGFVTDNFGVVLM